MDIILTDNQFRKINEQLSFKNKINSIVEKWENINNQERLFVLEYLKVINPEKKQEINSVIRKLNNKNINEAWYNTLLDVVGWIDPTGIADALNGVLYIKNGDYLFGFLSFVGAIPYLGDLVAKPVMYSLKIGAPSAKALNGVMALSAAGKTLKASEELAKISSRSSVVNTFLKGFRNIGDKLEELVIKMPNGPLKGFKKTILEWIQLFKNADRAGSIGLRRGRLLARQMKSKTKDEQIDLLNKFKQTLSSGPFSSYRTPSKLFSWKSFWSGMPQLMGRNASIRALTRKTKWYLGLLDFLGFANFVGPDELKNKLGDVKFEKAIEDYNKTAEASDYAKEDFGSEDIDQSSDEYKQQTKSQGSVSQGSEDPFSYLLKLML